MSTPFSEFYEFVRYTEQNKMIVLDYDDTFDIFDIIKLLPNKNPSNKDLRLALDLLDNMYPIYKNTDLKSKEDFLKDVFKFYIPKGKLKRLNSHKKILFKKVITSIRLHVSNNQVIITRVKK